MLSLDKKLACPVQERCGGCPQGKFTLEQQREHKIQQVRAGLAPFIADVEIQFHPYFCQEGYRNRIRIKIDDGKLSYFNSEKAAECSVLLPSLREQELVLRTWAQDKQELLQGFQYVEMRAPDLDGISVAHFYSKLRRDFSAVDQQQKQLSAVNQQQQQQQQLSAVDQQQLPALLSHEPQLSTQAAAEFDALEAQPALTLASPAEFGIHEAQPALTPAATSKDTESIRQEILREQKHPSIAFTSDEWPLKQRYPLTERVYQLVPSDAFMQVNFGVNQALIAEVLRGAESRSLVTLIDLYCGSGNFTLPLLAAGRRVESVEIQESAISALKQASLAQGLNGSFYAGDVAQWLKDAQREPEHLIHHAEALIIDPPRAGLKDAIDIVLALNRPYLVICSCNPKSLEKDLEKLVKNDYLVESVQLFDMFQHTEHVEVLLWLKRKSDS